MKVGSTRALMRLDVSISQMKLMLVWSRDQRWQTGLVASIVVSHTHGYLILVTTERGWRVSWKRNSPIER